MKPQMKAALGFFVLAMTFGTVVAIGHNMQAQAQELKKTQAMLVKPTMKFPQAKVRVLPAFSPSEFCYQGVVYLFISRGITAKLDQDGKVEQCFEKSYEYRF